MPRCSASTPTRRCASTPRCGRRTSTRGVRTLVERRPVGVVAAIVPWNYPVDLWCWKVAPAPWPPATLVVVKPPLETPLAVGAIVQCFEDTGLPAGVLSDLPGGADVGQAMVAAEGVGIWCRCTGSTAAGQAVVRASAERLPRLLLELGGHAPFVVLDDADVAAAAEAAARRSFSNMGQICIAVNRVIVAEQVAGSFSEALGAAAVAATGAHRRRRHRIRFDDHGRRQGATRRHIDDAVALGATLIVGGGDPAGCVPRPTSNRPCSTACQPTPR